MKFLSVGSYGLRLDIDLDDALALAQALQIADENIRVDDDKDNEDATKIGILRSLFDSLVVLIASQMVLSPQGVKDLAGVLTDLDKHGFIDRHGARVQKSDRSEEDDDPILAT